MIAVDGCRYAYSKPLSAKGANPAIRGRLHFLGCNLLRKGFEGIVAF